MASHNEHAWAKIREMRGVIVARRDEAEQLRRLPDAVARAFIEANVPRMMVPKDLGGEEIDALTYFDMAEELASYDGSVGWNFAICAGAPCMLGSLSRTRLSELFAEADACIAGSLMPSGRAMAVDGGVHLSGKWAWASGIHQAKWAFAGAVMSGGTAPPAAPGGPQAMTFCLVPAHEIAILDTWHTGGLRGTGSTEFTIENVFIPDENRFRPFPGESEHEATIFRMPFTFFGLGFAGVALGIAREAVAGLKNLAKDKNSFVSGALKDSGEAQYAVAKSDWLIEASRASVHETFAPIWERMKQGEPVGLDLRGRARGAYVAAVEAAQEAVVLCYRAAGGTALFQSAPFERALRDVFALSGHTVVRRARMETVGQVAFGQTPTTPFF